MARKETAKGVTSSKKAKTTNKKVEKETQEAKKKREDGVKNVKDKIHEGEELFADEINTAKSATKSFVNKAKVRLEENWQMLLGVLALALWLRRLWDLILWVILVILGVLLVSGYFKKEQ